MPKTKIRRTHAPLTFSLADLLNPVVRTLGERRANRERESAAAFAVNAKRVTANARKRELARIRKGVVAANAVAKRLGAKVSA